VTKFALQHVHSSATISAYSSVLQPFSFEWNHLEQLSETHTVTQGFVLCEQKHHFPYVPVVMHEKH